LTKLNETTENNENDFPFELIDINLQNTDEIDLEWIPFSNWLRYRFDNDGVIIITNTKLGHSIFTNQTTGMMLKLCNGKFNIIEIIQGIINKYPDENEAALLQDLLDVILNNYKIGNLVLMKLKLMPVE
jgi:hypothetical protein